MVGAEHHNFPARKARFFGRQLADGPNVAAVLITSRAMQHQIAYGEALEPCQLRRPLATHAWQFS